MSELCRKRLSYLIPFVRSLGYQSEALTDEFNNTIKIIKSKRMLSSAVQRSYQPRYEYRGVISGPRYIINKAKKVDPNAQLNEGQSKNHSILLAYSGAKYVGYQRQPWKGAINTIEQELLSAMLKSNWITDSHYWKPHKVRMEKASRTDSGVSASRQIVSVLMSKKTPSDVEIINSILPADIRIMGIKEVHHSFNPRKSANARTYTYMLPTIAFCRYNDQTRMPDFRLSADALTRINELLKVFEGWQNYHNFSVKKEAYETNSNRVIYSIQCEEPFVRDGTEFAVIRIKGASFLMHQIRRMIGLFLAVARNVVDATIFDQAFSTQNVRVPTAPGLGLVLDNVHYDLYNKRIIGNRNLDQLTWTEFDRAIRDFRETNIDPIIFRTEIENEVMLNWVEALLAWPFDDIHQIKDSNEEIDEEFSEIDISKKRYL